MDTKLRNSEPVNQEQGKVVADLVDEKPVKPSLPVQEQSKQVSRVSLEDKTGKSRIEEPDKKPGRSQSSGSKQGKPALEIADTKARKPRPFSAWISFALGVTIISVCMVTALAALGHSGGNWEALRASFVDYRNSIAFRERTGRYFNTLFASVTDSSVDNSLLESMQQVWSSEGENLKYYAINKDTGLVIENMNGDLSSILGLDNMPVLPDGYEYYWYFDGEKVHVVDHGELVDTKRLDSGYREVMSKFAISTGDLDSVANSRVILAVRNVLVKNPYEYSGYYQEQQRLFVAGRIYVGVLVLGVALFVYSMFRRQEKRAFDRKLASWSGRMWLEVKALLSLFVLVLIVAVGPHLFPGCGFGSVFNIAVSSGIVIVALWWFYVMLVDLITNGKRFFSHNSINSILAWYRNYERKYPWQRMMLKRAYALVFTEAVMALLSVFLVLMAFSGGGRGGSGLALVVALLLAGIGLYLIFRYLRRYGKTVADLGLLMDHIEHIKNGEMETKLHVAPDTDIYPAAQNLNHIQEGMSLAVSEKVKSERMKVDLITNVSHDLKTPLTSIVSYVELLAKEENLPEHVYDYIGILARKTERLKNLIQDLFDLSKATSDNLSLDMKRIDLARLINQALADMAESIDASGLAFRVNVPDEPVYIVSDGTKISRVFQNLISNTLKYSLLGSRVFIDLNVSGKEAVATIKNTANYEMDFDEDEILQRFTRGDRSRSTEGSGLGLSIAQSFTEACGGQFGIEIDGDQFKVKLRFETD